MQNLTRFILSQRIFIVLLTTVLFVSGLLSWHNLPIDAFPDVTNIHVMILTVCKGLSAPDVESRITFPIEQKMGGIPGITEVRSVSKPGLSQINVIFEDNVDIYFARQLVHERLQEAISELPEGIEPKLAPTSTGLGEIFQYTLESETLSPMELRTIQDWVVAPQLKPISGVTEVNSFGGFVKQYHVQVEPDMLEKYSLSLREFVSAIQENNTNAGGGFIVKGWEQMYIRSIGLLSSKSDIENIVLKASGGSYVRVKDVANVSIGAQTRQGGVSRDGKGETVAGMVIMLKGENSKAVVERVKEKVSRIESNLPEDVRIDVFYDRTTLIQACISTVMNAMGEGAIGVIIILFLFLAELRTALIVVMAIPCSFLATFIMMQLTGTTSNLMSLGGLAFSVGMIVDASIIVTENARRHLTQMKQGDSQIETILRAVTEVARPVCFSILIVVLILVPMFTLQGMEGKMFIPLALTMLFALLSSMFVAFLIVPALAEIFLRPSPDSEFWIVDLFRRLYESVLSIVLKIPYLVLAATFALFLVAGSLGMQIGSEFMPELDEGAIAINAVRLPNASLDGSIHVSTKIEKLLSGVPEISTIVSKTGRAEISEDPMGPEQTDFIIMLKSPAELPTARSRIAVMQDIEKLLNLVPGLRYSFSQPIALRVNEMLSGIKSQVAIKVFGDDLDILTRLAQRIADATSSIKGAHDVHSAHIARMAQYDVEIDRNAASRHGINVSEVNELINVAIGGIVATTLIEGQRRFSVLVRYPLSIRDDIDKIMQLRVRTPEGSNIPLAQIATVQRVEVPMEVTRENGMRRVVVEANVRGRDLGSFISELQNRLKEIEDSLPSGYFISLGGQFENQQRAMKRLSLVVPVALLIILVLLVMALGSLRDALLVILNLPFALVGAVVALWWTGMTFSVSSVIACIVLLGIAVQDGVLLVAFCRRLINEGRTVDQAVRESCSLRYRAIVMTSLTSFIGHLPMLLATGPGADIQRPLAVVVTGGLFSSTLLTLLVIPVVFSLVESAFPAGASE